MWLGLVSAVLRAARRPPRGWRPLSSQPGPLELFATPAFQRFLDRQQHRRGSAPEVAALTRLLRAKEGELRDTERLAREDENEDLRKLAEKEIISCQEELAELKRQIVLHLIPSEETDESDLIMEVTAGVGGKEAMLFTAEMFNMYQQYAVYKNWNFDILEYTSSDIGGLRHASATIAGPEAYRQMKFEGGVHRVQRVPKTEKQGRIHTSTMTVAILPQPNEINLTLNPKELRIETKRASGAGGQHVNTTDSAVRIVHIPTGVVSECQQERSQIRNKEKAMQILRAKLYSMKLEEELTKRETARKIQTGTKGRSEKIRTYNFPQDRVTDHRISRSVHHIEQFMLGEELLDEMIEALREYADFEALIDVISESNPTKLR
ncbi:peptide chain release factor 1-like, mitochondrial isoform X1 [Sceloporus undulatus]|uniref:peptide chain release factor 1-like, mitochondrial isoform X1 n=2 Tax=Sceloporus undulatus TaxID=8520 RepID=UPI001C4BA941|nr:peptide chain release factor 1-like, mitochondrial isoform X1 [Sceloporus undulatus]XP_042335077.1 peptide chain release factor 1-like, mitochondrial isoform X1 [Sceloporus undulatus]